MKPLLALTLLLSGCSAAPMTPAQWERELRYRKQSPQAGVTYKGPHQIRAEAVEMRKVVEETLTKKP